MRHWICLHLLVTEIVFPHDAITADWMAQLLRDNGYRASITGMTSCPIGTGQVGATYRFELEYEIGAGTIPNSAPRSIVGKFPSNDELSRATGKSHQTYIREAGFYRHFAGKKPLPIPHHLYIAFDDDSHDFTLIMHDLPNHRAGNQLAFPTRSETQLAVHAAAQIHAAWWGDPVLDTLPWLNGSKAATDVIDVELLYTNFWPAFCARFGDRVTPDMRRVGEAYLGNVANWLEKRVGPRCLTHNDFRPDNMLFDESDTANPIVIVDWQTVGVGSGAADLAYFTGTALDPAARRASEAALLDQYTTALAEYGVPECDTLGMWDDYRAAAFSGFLMGVTAAIVVQQTERGDAMFLAMCERSAAMVTDHADLTLCF